MQVNKAEEVQVDIVGSSTFGRYPKISVQKTINMFVSDGWLVNYAGFSKKIEVLPSGEGRGIFNSTRGGFLIVVVANQVFRINDNFNKIYLGIITTNNGSVSIDENLSAQICIVDGENAYLYNYETNPTIITLQTLMFSNSQIIPNYVCYHNTFFLFGSSPDNLNPNLWFAFEKDTNTTLKINTQFSLQTKPDIALAVKRLPGRGNNVLVMGSTVCEVWTQTGGLENYRRLQSFNIDNGVVSSSTVAANEDYICWLAQNENNAPFIMISDGSSSKRISTDGIDYVLSNIKSQGKSCAFFYRQDGHLFYHLTFYDPVDNITILYDFTNGMFFNASDQNMNYYPARQAAFFQDSIYFVSIKDGGLYFMDTNLLTYSYSTDPLRQGEEIPRVRICKTIKKNNSDRFRCSKFRFTLEQGVVGVNVPARSEVQLSFSKDGGQTFGQYVSKQLNTTAHFKNQITWHRLGDCNEIILQLRFIGFQRFVASDGFLETF